MNYTEKYHLPQWEEDDRVMRSDFNNAMAALEDGLSTVQRAAEQAAEKAEDLPYVAGSYTGLGRGQSFEFGFRPSAIVIGLRYSGSDVNRAAGMCVFCAGDGIPNKVYTRPTGFELWSDDGSTYPSVNEYGKDYAYIAFR